MKIHIITDTILPEEEVATTLEFKAIHLNYIAITSMVFDVLLIWFMMAAHCNMIIIGIVLFFVFINMYYSFKVSATIYTVYDFYEINLKEDVNVLFMNSGFKCTDVTK